MFTDVTNDIESTDHEESPQSERDPLIQHDKVITKKEARVARAQFLALCWALFVIGWNDGSTGPLLPSIQNFYNIGYGTVSWVFIVECTGAVLGALLNIPLGDKLGFGKMLALGPVFQMTAFFIQYLEPPFPMFVIAFGIGGIGMVFQDASANGFIATLQRDSEYKMGWIHAAYGVGALTAPLSATYFSQTTQWSRHYLISCLLALSNMLSLAIIFKLQGRDACLRRAGETVTDKNANEDVHKDKFSQLMKNKTVHLLAAFLLIYIGVEVTIGGWIVTFMIHIRGGGPKTGYVSTGYFGGLTLGRVVLIEVTKMIGPINAVYIYGFLAISFQLIVWLVPSFIASAISVAIIGLLLGPMYPIAINHAARILPDHLVNATVGWMAACGAGGSALLPFVTGAMAAKLGIQSLQPLVLGMMAILVTLWFCIPKKPKVL